MQPAASPASIALAHVVAPVDRRIIVEAQRGGRARVLIEPRLDREPPPESFPTLAAARSFAAGVHIARAWPIVERVAA